MNFASREWGDVAGTIVGPKGYGDFIKANGRDSILAYVASWLSARDDVDFIAPGVRASDSDIAEACEDFAEMGVKVVESSGFLVRIQDSAGRVFEIDGSSRFALVRYGGNEYSLAGNSVEGLSASIAAVLDATSDESDD
jgi:hypothetical protein